METGLRRFMSRFSPGLPEIEWLGRTTQPQREYLGPLLNEGETKYRGKYRANEIVRWKGYYDGKMDVL